ncbi:hypothetical protein VNO77_22657 [Canavalia gladiata]|uniref:Uncharacterized protein n=1 Tax=Canavalia gladiata TaxID=3824 RepID=A0AAN9QAZ7_CANGL
MVGSRAYREGKIYGIDASSRAAVMDQGIMFWTYFILTIETGEFGLEETGDMFKEWTSKRPWKERKMAKKSGTAQLVSKFHPLELIYYGPYSGVVGLTERELYMTLSDEGIANHGFDKVLVDAECTYDGSVKHIQKFEHLTVAQNEDVVEQFLKENETAERSFARIIREYVGSKQDMTKHEALSLHGIDTYQKTGARGSMHARSLILKMTREGA